MTNEQKKPVEVVNLFCFKILNTGGQPNKSKLKKNAWILFFIAYELFF